MIVDWTAPDTVFASPLIIPWSAPDTGVGVPVPPVPPVTGGIADFIDIRPTVVQHVAVMKLVLSAEATVTIRTTLAPGEAPIITTIQARRPVTGLPEPVYVPVPRLGRVVKMRMVAEFDFTASTIHVTHAAKRDDDELILLLLAGLLDDD